MVKATATPEKGAEKCTFIEEAQNTVDRLNAELASMQEQVKAKKAIVKDAEHRRDALIRLGPDALKQQQPLFETPEEKPNGKPKKTETKAAKPGKNKAWRSLPVKDAIAVGAVVNQLEAWSPPVVNLGELFLWLKKNKFTQLPGVGEDKAAQAADQLGEWQKANPQYDF
jgi:hypothetical protein